MGGGALATFSHTFLEILQRILFLRDQNIENFPPASRSIPFHAKQRGDPNVSNCLLILGDLGFGDNIVVPADMESGVPYTTLQASAYRARKTRSSRSSLANAFRTAGATLAFPRTGAAWCIVSFCQSVVCVCVCRRNSEELDWQFRFRRRSLSESSLSSDHICLALLYVHMRSVFVISEYSRSKVRALYFWFSGFI